MKKVISSGDLEWFQVSIYSTVRRISKRSLCGAVYRPQGEELERTVRTNKRFRTFVIRHRLSIISFLAVQLQWSAEISWQLPAKTKVLIPPVAPATQRSQLQAQSLTVRCCQLQCFLLDAPHAPQKFDAAHIQMQAPLATSPLRDEVTPN